MFRIVFCFLRFLALTSVAAAAIDLDREIIFSPPNDTSAEDVAIARWQARASAEAARLEDFERLGWAYVAKARRTLDAGYYKLAEKTVDVAEAQCGSRPELALLRGHVLHNLHRFAAAEEIAARLVAERGVPADLALLSDTLVDQGKLAPAIATLERLVQLKPGTEALTRIAHVRWLKGDLPGAIAAMQSALDVVSPSDATTSAWVLTRLSAYLLQAGDTGRALAAASRALALAPGFAPALFARGRAELAANHANVAAQSFAEAARTNPTPEYQWWLADTLRAIGHPAEATAVEAILAERGAQEDQRTFALYLATRAVDPVRAVKLARDELGNRRDVHTHDALAWALAVSGNSATAAIEMQAALAEHTNDPRLLLHAGIIAQTAPALGSAVGFFARAHAGAAMLTPSERALLDREIAASLHASLEILP